MEGNCSEIKKLFAENDKTIVIDGEKKKQALEQIRTNMQGNASSVQKSKWQILKIQICYMDKAILLMHLTVCIGFVLLGKWQFWERSSTIFACVLGALSLIEVSHMFFSGMTEVEESCYFNVRQIVVFRMACSGIISLAALLADSRRRRGCASYGNGAIYAGAVCVYRMRLHDCNDYREWQKK